MPTAVWHALGPAEGSCTVCGAEGSLSLGEARFSRNLVERLRREYCSPPARFVTCASCGWRWSVRADDRGADGVRRRSGTVRDDVPRPRAADPARPSADPARLPADPLTASRTVLPQQPDRRRGRDWAYPRG
ncbi:MAG TPA: hypothetical protein VNU26_11860 [Mycobacteriales bacterium]|nr:hypothetical protein [Mycobacteriales bacterium]